jgi:hypothetical protein
MGSNPIPRTLGQSRASEDLCNFVLWLKKKVVRGRRLCDDTMAGKVRILKQLSKKVNLWDADAVSEHVENADWTNLRKNLVLYAYQDWCSFKGFSFKFARAPNCRRTDTQGAQVKPQKGLSNHTFLCIHL